jgi:hypothetical protein
MVDKTPLPREFYAVDGMKKCRGECGKIKPVSEYYSNNNAADGMCSSCKQCYRDRLEEKAKLITVPEYKRCGGECAQVKQAAEFYSALSSPDGLSYSCRKCTNAANKARAEYNKERTSYVKWVAKLKRQHESTTKCYRGRTVYV